MLRVRWSNVHQLRHQRFTLPGVPGEQGPAGSGRGTQRGRVGLRRWGRTIRQWRRRVDQYLNDGGCVAGGSDGSSDGGTWLDLDGRGACG